MNTFFRIWLFLACIASSSVFAAQVKGLYEAEVPVAATDNSVLADAFKIGLQRVFLKTTGRKEVLGSAAVQDALANAGRFVQQYAFLENPRFQAEMDVSEFNTPYLIKVSYQKKALLGILSQSGQPVWGNNRPSVLVWLVLEEERNRRLVSGSEGELFVETMLASAQDWGVPIFFPVMDLEDTANVSVSDVWGGFLQPVQSASVRYQPDIVLLLKVSQLRSGEWLSQGTLASASQTAHFEYSVDDKALLAAGMMEWVTGSIADRYAVLRAEETVGEVILNVSGVEDYDHFVGLLNYVSSLTPVTEVVAQRVAKDRVSLSVKMHGYTDKLQQYIGLDSALIPELGEVGIPGDTFSMSYRWNR